MTAKQRWEVIGVAALILGLTWLAYAGLAWAIVGVVWLPYFALTGRSGFSHAIGLAYQPRLLALIGSICLAVFGLVCIWHLCAGMFGGLWAKAMK